VSNDTLLVSNIRFRIDNEVHCERAHPLCDAIGLNQRGLNAIKLAYDRHRPDGRLT